LSEVVTRRVMKPRDCVVAFGIPTTREAFFHALRTPQGRDFIPNCCPDWQDYYFQIASYADRLVPLMERMGTAVVRDVPLQGFGELLRRARHPVVILFSHWRGEAVEFADGLAPVPAVIREVPDPFRGIIDLCVCHPDSLALQLGDRWPHSVVKFTGVETTPALWLYIYFLVMRILSREDTTYLDAVERVTRVFLTEGRINPP
jgi:hypothetical protein